MKVAIFFFAAGLEDKSTEKEIKDFAEKSFQRGLREGKIKPIIVDREVAEIIYDLLGRFERDN